MDSTEDFEDFLKNVDQISQLLRDLQSSDVEAQQEAFANTDSYIATLEEPCRTKVNRTTINTNPPSQPSLSSQKESLEGFMRVLEKDAEDRRIKRIAQEKKATALKDKGNKAYAQEDYETAVKFYSDGLAKLKDMQPLYTNRAQAYIKLSRYKEAISDCEWALKCNEKCTKAYLHMGKAYIGLKKFNEAKNSFQKIQEIDPAKEKLVKEYLDVVVLEEKREKQEISATKEMEKGERKVAAIPELLEKLSRPRLMPLYYCGGLEVLLQAITDCTGQTLFRLNNGFSVISGNDVLRSCLFQETKDPGSQESCVCVLKLWRIVCHDNEENQKTLLACPVAKRSVVELVTSDDVEVAEECLDLLSLYSKTTSGIHLVIDNLNMHKLVENLMVCIFKAKQQLEITAAHILKNVAANERFRIQLRTILMDSVVVPISKTLSDISTSNPDVLLSLISVLGCLAHDEVIRQCLAHDRQCWKAFLTAIRECSAAEYKEALYILLGLIINLSSIQSPTIQEHAVCLCDCCLDLLKASDGGIITRATGVLSTVLPQSRNAVQHAVQMNVVQTMCRLLKGKGQTATKYAIKTLTVCSAASDKAREELLKSDKKLCILRHLLGSSCDEVISGNAALCLSHCLELEGVATQLLGSNIVLLLLQLAASDAKKTAVQQNAAIALGKLCRSEPRHVHRLRELHGLEILHSCLQLLS